MVEMTIANQKNGFSLLAQDVARANCIGKLAVINAIKNIGKVKTHITK